MSLGIYNVAWALVLLPLFGAAISFLAESPRRAAQTCAVSSLLAFLLAAVVIAVRLKNPLGTPYVGLLTFFSMTPPESTLFAARFQPQVGLLVDSMSASFGFAIAFVVAVVQSYALTTLRGDAGYRRFFWASSLLSFAVLGIVFSPNIFDAALLVLLGSAAVYLVAAHWWDRSDAAAPARRAFLALHVGDVALLLGVVIVFIKFGAYAGQVAAPAGQTIADPFGFDQQGHFATAVLQGLVHGAGLRTLAVIAAIFVFASVVRAAQLPFHVWLTDVATSPVPALALIAGTVAVAGVYLLARVYPFLLSPLHALTALSLTGAATAVFAALVCMTQRDILRIAVLAVVTELGFAMAALGAGGYGQSLFVLFTSILFSALLFLAAGNLMRVYRTRNIHEMGGAWRRLRSTRLALVVWAGGFAGLSLNTYYAMSSVFANRQPLGVALGDATRIAVAVLLGVAVLLSAGLAVRLLRYVLPGEPARRRGFQHERVAEVEPPLRRATRLLTLGAIASVLVGLPGISPVHSGTFSVPGLTFTRFVYETVRPSIPVDGLALVIVLAVAAIGGAATWLALDASRRAALTAQLDRVEPLVHLITRGFNLERYAHRLGRPFVVAGGFVNRFDDSVTESLADTVAQGSQLASGLLARTRAQRSALYLAGGLAVAAVLALLSILAATGHFWIHSL